MAEAISIQIALEGGKEVQRQLAAIGEEGQQAFEKIAKSAEKAGGFKSLKPEEVTAKLKELGVTGEEAINKIQNAVKTAVRFENLVQGAQSVEDAFASLGRAAGPILAGIAAGLALATKLALSFAESINKASAEAMKIGLSVQQYDQLRGALEKAGISAKAITSGLEKLGQAADKAALDKVAKAFTELQDAATRGFGAVGTRQLKDLEDAAKKAGTAGKAAREDLIKLGQPIPTGVAKTLEELIASTGSAKAGLEAFVRQLQAMPPGADRATLAIQELGDNLGSELVGALQTGSIDQFLQALSQISPRTEEQVAAAARARQSMEQLSAAWDRFKETVVAPIATPILDAISSAIPTIISSLQALGQAITGTFSGLSDPIAATTRELYGIGQAITTAASAVSSFASSIAGVTWDAISSVGVAAWNALTSAIQNAVDAVLRFIGLKSSGSAPTTGDSAAMASGGLIGGRGTGTSDSNLAWVSRGEHIMPARAVSQPGVFAFLEALRRSGGNLRGVLDGLGRFALGGLVPRPIPAFVGGGAVGGMSHVTIQFPGLPAINGLRASSDVVGELQRAAALAQVRSGGRKPSRYT